MHCATVVLEIMTCIQPLKRAAIEGLNYRRWLKFGLLAVAALALASGNAQAAPRSTGTLIVYRAGTGIAGAARTYSFSVDGGPRYKLKPGCYMRFELPAGNHSLRHPFDITLNFGSETQWVQIIPGQTVYFQYAIVPFVGMVFEVADDQVQARETASGCRLQEGAVK